MDNGEHLFVFSAAHYIANKTSFVANLTTLYIQRHLSAFNIVCEELISVCATRMTIGKRRFLKHKLLVSSLLDQI